MKSLIEKNPPTPDPLELDAVDLLAKRQLRASPRGSLARNVYGVFGIPVDAVDSDDVIQAIGLATESRKPLFISTPNLNYLVKSNVEREFRESLLLSDLCPADGMPVVWLCSLLGVPIKKRISGSDIFDQLKSQKNVSPCLKVFLFGGPEGAAEKVSSLLNKSSGMRCVGSIYPGFGSIAEMSSSEIINKINSSEADLLAVFLTASKGQAWLLQNHSHLNVPVRVHLGATINFQAGSIRRAPSLMRKVGLEWIWRIKEEPYLWKRYWSDGLTFLSLIFTRALPITIIRFKHRLWSVEQIPLKFTLADDASVLRLTGDATAAFVNDAISEFERHMKRQGKFTIDVSELSEIDSRFFGLLLALRKQLIEIGGSLVIRAYTKKIRVLFRLNGFEFLLSREEDS